MKNSRQVGYNWRVGREPEDRSITKDKPEHSEKEDGKREKRKLTMLGMTQEIATDSETSKGH